MNSYSGNTRITLTATGWLLIAQEALAGIEQGSDQKQSGQLRTNAKNSLRMALVAIDEDDRNRPTLSQPGAHLATSAE
jgi:hypothetical protein